MITRELLSKWGACERYRGARLDEIVGSCTQMTARDACALAIPHSDKMWLLTHALWERDPWLCYDFALWCAEQALTHVEPSWRARAEATLDGVRGLRGRSAAWVARAAAEAAEAAWAAAAARAAAWAAGAAAEAAAWAARAAGAAGAAAEAAQINRAIEMLEAE